MSKFRFQKWLQTLTLDFAANSTVVSVANVPLNGLLHSTIMKTPATVDTAATVGLTITNAEGAVVFSRTGVAAGSNAPAILTTDTRVPLAGIFTITITFSAAQTANRATDVTLLIDRGA